MFLMSFGPEKKQFRRGNKYRGAFRWDEHIATIADDREFIKYYKLTPSQFDALVADISPLCSSKATS